MIAAPTASTNGMTASTALRIRSSMRGGYPSSERRAAGSDSRLTTGRRGRRTGSVGR
jgi:hypothetical protein